MARIGNWQHFQVITNKSIICRTKCCSELVNSFQYCIKAHHYTRPKVLIFSFVVIGPFCRNRQWKMKVETDLQVILCGAQAQVSNRLCFTFFHQCDNCFGKEILRGPVQRPNIKIQSQYISALIGINQSPQIICFLFKAPGKA